MSIIEPLELLQSIQKGTWYLFHNVLRKQENELPSLSKSIKAIKKRGSYPLRLSKNPY